MLVDKFGQTVLDEIKFLCEKNAEEWDKGVSSDVKRLWLNSILMDTSKLVVSTWVLVHQTC